MRFALLVFAGWCVPFWLICVLGGVLLWRDIRILEARGWL
jgi:hypothetical protein